MLSILKERKENELNTTHENQLKKALAQKCANMGDQYANHKEDKTEYTVLTINGKTLQVKKEEITIESPN